MGITRR